MSDGKKGGIGKWILIGVISVFVLLAICCGGCALMTKFGIGAMEEMVSAELRQSPALVEHVGTIRSLDFKLMETGQLGRQNALVFRVEGSKGSGRIVAVMPQQQTRSDGTMQLLEATLTLDGDLTEIDLLAEDEAPPVELPEPEGGTDDESR